jgi:hypothetical protein
VQVFIEQSEGAALLAEDPVPTDAQGAFRLTSLAPGSYDLRLVKEGYRWGELRDVRAGTENVEVTLEPGIRVAGRVVSTAREPSPAPPSSCAFRSRTSRAPKAPWPWPSPTSTSSGRRSAAPPRTNAGRFALESFAAGTYELMVHATGFWNIAGR